MAAKTSPTAALESIRRILKKAGILGLAAGQGTKGRKRKAPKKPKAPVA